MTTAKMIPCRGKREGLRRNPLFKTMKAVE
jgi:hypothetical protein